MIVCVCHRVSDRDIARAVRAGCSSFEGLQQTLGVATACGRCRSCATDVFHQQRCGAALVPGQAPAASQPAAPMAAIAAAAGNAANAANAAMSAVSGALPVVRWHRPLARPHSHAALHTAGHAAGHPHAHVPAPAAPAA